MLPLSDKTWDIQFQPDNPLDHWGDHYNIGWYFARATPATQEYFRTAFVRWIAKGTGPVDQNTMNEVIREMIPTSEHFKNGTVLNVHLLDVSIFRNFMNDPWDWSFFGNDAVATEYITNSTAIHFTCIQHSLKTYFGLNFGGYADMDGYYSKPPSLLRMENISGTSEAVRRQVTLALAVANKLGRTTLWPDSVNMFEKGDGTNYGYRKNLPGVVAMDYNKAENAGYKVVEGRYLRNREMMGLGSKKEYTVNLKETATVGALESLGEKVPNNDVIVLDFTSFGVNWERLAEDKERKQPEFSEAVVALEGEFYQAFNRTGMEEFSQAEWEKVPACGRANSGPGCLNNC